jgi:hypothetical protein
MFRFTARNDLRYVMGVRGVSISEFVLLCFGVEGARGRGKNRGRSHWYGMNKALGEHREKNQTPDGIWVWLPRGSKSPPY